jgi:hypothetical protein
MRVSEHRQLACHPGAGKTLPGHDLCWREASWRLAPDAPSGRPLPHLVLRVKRRELRRGAGVGRLGLLVVLHLLRGRRRPGWVAAATTRLCCWC